MLILFHNRHPVLLNCDTCDVASICVVRVMLSSSRVYSCMRFVAAYISMETAYYSAFCVQALTIITNHRPSIS